MTCKSCGVATECYHRTDELDDNHSDEHPELEEYQPNEDEIHRAGG